MTQEKRCSDMERELRGAEESLAMHRVKLESAEFAQARLQREIASHTAQAAKHQDEAVKVRACYPSIPLLRRDCCRDSCCDSFAIPVVFA